jgi:hypothetical protein
MPKQCIICRKEKGSFNEEHVILDTIGGALKIYSVCKDCNTSLSKNFNVPFLEEPTIGICRQILQLSRKKGKRGIRNPLEKAVVKSQNGFEKFNASFNKGQLITKRTPEVKISKRLSGYEVNIKAAPAEIEGIKSSILKKYGSLESELKNISFKSSEKPLEIHYETKAKPIIYEGLKVAYEFTATVLPNYLSDEWSLEYSKFIETGKESEFVKEKIDAISCNQKIWLADYEQLSGFPIHLHLIYLRSYKDFGLVCIVKLFNYFTFHHLSSESILDSDIVVLLVNDPIERKCEAREIKLI